MNNTAHRSPHKISPRQIKIIHTIKTKLGLDDAAYRTLLRGYAVKSSKELLWREAEDLIAEMNKKAGATTSFTSHPSLLQLRYAELDGRPGMCNGKQARLIGGMWAEVSRAEDDDAREKALFAFLRRICGVDHFRFLKSYQVQKVVKAIETMKGATP